jgi:hypothetical protein
MTFLLSFTLAAYLMIAWAFAKTVGSNVHKLSFEMKRRVTWVDITYILICGMMWLPIFLAVTISAMVKGK